MQSTNVMVRHTELMAQITARSRRLTAGPVSRLPSTQSDISSNNWQQNEEHFFLNGHIVRVLWCNTVKQRDLGSYVGDWMRLGTWIKKI